MILNNLTGMATESSYLGWVNAPGADAAPNGDEVRMEPKPTVFVVDDDEALRDSLRWLFESAGLPVRAFADASEFLAGYDPACPGCLVLDERLPGMGGLQLQEHLGTNGPHLPIIILTGHGDVPTAVQALKAGALDFLTKPFDSDELLARVRQAVDRDQQARRERAWTHDIRARFALLTPRERQVMRLVVAGKPNKVIAAELGVSTKTVEAHRTHIMDKARAESVADLVRMAIACGVHVPGPATPAPPAENVSAPSPPAG